MKNPYRILYILLIVVVLGTFLGLYKVLEIKEPSMESIEKSILDVADLTYMVEGDSQKLRKLYYINKSEIEDFILFAPKTNMDANEVLVIKAKSEENVDDLKAKIEERVEKQSNSFQSYRPELKDIIDDNVLEVKGEYLILIISTDSRDIKAAINKNFK